MACRVWKSLKKRRCYSLLRIFQCVIAKKTNLYCEFSHPIVRYLQARLAREFRLAAVDIGGAREHYARPLSRDRTTTEIMTLCLQKQDHAIAVQRRCRVRPSVRAAGMLRPATIMVFAITQGGAFGMH